MVATHVFKHAGAYLLACIFFIGIAAAAPHVNVTIVETVNQNVTFAADFDLVEERTFSFIEGVITVENPGDESVFDVYVVLDQVLGIESDFINRGESLPLRRDGFQIIFPDLNDTTVQINDTIESTWFDIGADLDEDGGTDFIAVNNTHLLFNISSEDNIISVPFSNQTNSSLDISASETFVNMTFQLVSQKEDTEHNDGWAFANISVVGEVTTPGVLVSPGEVNVTITDLRREYAVFHIPELRTGQQSVFDYNVSLDEVDPPLNITSFYTNPEFNTKVLAGEHFGVQLLASNIAEVGALEKVNITLQTETVTVTNGSVSQTFDFTLHNLSETADFANVQNSSNRTWYWTVNAGTIDIGEEYNISFEIRAPDTVNSSGTFLALTQTLAYEIGTSASMLNVADIRARASVVFNETKRIVSPQDALDNRNVTWESEPKIGADENITFTLEKVSMWVTEVLDPNEVAYDLRTSEFNIPASGFTFDQDITWTGDPWRFNFTDGSRADSPPPIVWVKPYWIISNVNDQLINSSFTVNGTDVYMNYIYVVNGYWLEVQKRVLDAEDAQYNIQIEVRNRGNGHTPQNMTVTVYDFIAEEFEAWNFSPSPNQQSNVTGQFSGVAYQWDAGLRTNISTSFAPRGDPLGLDWFHINYTVNGSGDFSPSDLYIVGLDPRAIDGANTFEGVSVVSAIASTSREMVYLAIVVFLIAINLANFLMTSRISRKLDRK